MLLRIRLRWFTGFNGERSSRRILLKSFMNMSSHPPKCHCTCLDKMPKIYAVNFYLYSMTRQLLRYLPAVFFFCSSVAAFLLSVSFLLVDEIPCKNNESLTGPVTVKAGYWIWVCSIVALVIAVILNNSERSDKWKNHD